MIISSLEVFGLLGEKVAEYRFSSKNTLIYSSRNSKGKTTLLRFILYGMGYAIPATKRIGDFANYRVELQLKDCSIIRIVRKGRFCEVFYNNGDCEKYVLPECQYALQNHLFSLDSDIILANLLAVFYIDQEKGWTMLNRGKIIGNIRFKVEDFVGAIAEHKAEQLRYSLECIKLEIKKHKNMLLVADLQTPLGGDSFEQIDNSVTVLISERKRYAHLLSDAKKQLNDYMEIQEHSDYLIKIIEKNNLHLIVDNRRIKITKNNLEHYTENHDYLQRTELTIKRKIQEYSNKIAALDVEINKRSKLFDLQSEITRMEQELSSFKIDRGAIEHNLARLKQQQRILSKERKDFLIKQPCTTYLYQKILKYAEELDLKKYFHNENEDFVFTNDLKGYSGMILAQLAFIFKMAYADILEENYNIRLPFLVDSPRTSEMTAEAAKNMLSLVQKYHPERQLIVASVYDDFLPEGDYQIIQINAGVFNKM